MLRWSVFSFELKNWDQKKIYQINLLKAESVCDRTKNIPLRSIYFSAERLENENIWIIFQNMLNSDYAQIIFYYSILYQNFFTNEENTTNKPKVTWPFSSRIRQILWYRFYIHLKLPTLAVREGYFIFIYSILN